MHVYAIDRCTYFKWEAFYILESNMYRLQIFQKRYYPKFQVFWDMMLCHWASGPQHFERL